MLSIEILKVILGIMLKLNIGIRRDILVFLVIYIMYKFI